MQLAEGACGCQGCSCRLLACLMLCQAAGYVFCDGQPAAPCLWLLAGGFSCQVLLSLCPASFAPRTCNHTCTTPTQPYGLSCADNVAKECWEEAGVPPELAAAAVPVGFVSYVSLSEEGLKPDVLFCYDLQLPADFVPKPQDGEVGLGVVGTSGRARGVEWLFYRAHEGRGMQ